jgi:oxygen-independent coproporphyrinogen-3 oxidase
VRTIICKRPQRRYSHSPFRVSVAEEGRNFLRNICMAFDARYWQKQPEGRLFSQAV